MRTETGDFMVGVDIGGTFTDCVIMDASGTITTGKSPSTPADRSKGFFASIECAAQELGLDRGSLLERTSRLVHGTTTADNTMIEMSGARTGLITTEGHRDEIENTTGDPGE